MLHFIFSDKEYYRKMWVMALPLILQNAITSSVNLIDTLMVGSFGDVSLAAVNLSNQFYFFFNMLVFGIVGGGAILNAQYWGKGDKPNLHRVMGVQFIGCLLFGLAFSAVTFFIPHKIIACYTRDPQVIAVGASYLRALSPSYVFFALTQVFSNANRCTGNTRLPMAISASSLILKVFFNYSLIFGNFGFPKLGIHGAALTTLFARLIECSLLILLTYALRMPAAASPRQAFSFDKKLTGKAIRNIVPVMVNEGLWGLGTNVYSKIYAGISTASIAAFSAVSPIDSLMFMVFVGVGDACAILVGNFLGANEKEKAYVYGKRTVFLSAFLSIAIGITIFALRHPILRIYNLSPAASAHAAHLLSLMALLLWTRTTNYTIFIGVLRAGGDIRFCLALDAGAMWLVGIPTGFLMANVFHLSVTLVYLGIMSEEIVKLLLLVRRFSSRKWVNNLVG